MFEHQWGEPKLVPYSYLLKFIKAFHYAHLLYMDKFMTLCVTVEFRLSHIFEAIHCECWTPHCIHCCSSGGDCKYERTCSSRFMHALHVGRCGLNLPKWSRWLPRSGCSLHYWIKRIHQPNCA